MPLTLIGVNASPFVRKVRVVLEEKRIPYTLEPLIPFDAPPEYRRLHPLGKIPTLRDGELVIPDSSAICAYLELRHPTPALFPSDPYERARAIWLEELGDAGVSTGTGPVFFQRVVKPYLLQEMPDDGPVERALTQTLPPLFDYLERELGDGPYLMGELFSIADIAVATQLANWGHAGGRVDAELWPRLALWADRILARPSFEACLEEERETLGLE